VEFGFAADFFHGRISLMSGLPWGNPWTSGNLKEISVANELVSKLIEAGAHFGHRVSRWNPKMAPYIYGRKNLIHIIDIRETLRGMLRAKKYLSQVAQGGSLVLFVGTKRQASEVIQREATRCGMPFVSERWLGGCLTNFRTIRDRMGRLEELETIMNSDKLNGYSKKMQSALSREYRKIYRNLNGIRTLNRMPECLVIIDPKKEKNAIREAKALGITTVALIDTDCDPSQVDLVIPGNDDGIRSIDLIVKQLADAVLAGKSENPELMKTVPQSAPASAVKDAVSEMAAMAEKEALG
jgi:small subunit ribosomal protein S2